MIGGGLAAVAATFGAIRYFARPGETLAAEAPSKKAFNGEFISLKLSEVEKLSQNTKRFRFELPESDMVSGLPVACE